ncbi:MAG: hypothetical protein GX234_12220 [Clostridiales bacterium]|nr:hypothetical protein [Clostridiales bacterium]
MAEQNVRISLDDYNRPLVCNVCGGRMIYKGVGEYQCEKCANLDYDDYGKVRAYIETHPNQRTMQDIEIHTGVPRKTIRQMLKEERIEIAKDSTVFIQCEICRKSIRSGRYCEECAKKVRIQEAAQKAQKNHHKSMQGFGQHNKAQEGEKRFHRER